MIKNEYRVLAMSRSGHHPIINWIRFGFDKSKFINNVGKYQDPIESFPQIKKEFIMKIHH